MTILLNNGTYIHHRSQNEMIEVIGKSIIQQDLINEIKGARFTLYYEMRSLHLMIKSCLCVFDLWMPENKSEKNSRFK